MGVTGRAASFHVYTDGSKSPRCRAGSGVAIYDSADSPIAQASYSLTVDNTVFQAEIAAITAAARLLRGPASLAVDRPVIFIYSDSQAVLLSLTSQYHRAWSTYVMRNGSQ